MAEGQVKEVLEKEIICPLCLDIFREPKKLPCDHVYCKECLRILVQSVRPNVLISCPECRSLTQPPGNDVNNFCTAFQINRLVDTYHQVKVPEQRKVDLLSAKGTVCWKHTTEQLVFYCETCNQSLCQDCVVMTKDHEGHKYGFFEKVAPKYRKKLLSELSDVKTQETSISAALKEVVDAGNSVVSHKDKCLEDIEKAFEDMFSVLEQCKEKMKEEASKHYSSLIGIFESKAKQLEKAESKLKKVTTSAIASVQGDDQHFLMKVDSMMEQIQCMQERLETIPLKIIEPQLLTAQAESSEVLLQCFRTLCSLYNLANPRMCKVEGAITYMHVDQQESLILSLNDSAEQTCKGGANSVHANLVNPQGQSTKGIVEGVSMGCVKINITPERRGKQKLNVKVNGAHVAKSPFTVFVNMPPELLSQPVTTISGLKNPTGLVYSQRKILAIETGEDRIVAVNSEHGKQEISCLTNASEITADASLNLYVTATTDHKLHKLSKGGRNIRSIGRLGKENGEFNFPNGLKVSKKNELYVCDSGNHRIQVLDLDLNFKRSFGKKGTGKGHFDSPLDIDFDSNGYIYVLDCGNCRIQVFTQDERHFRTIGYQTYGTTFDLVRLLLYNDHIYTTAYFSNYIVVMNTAGDIITKFGGEILCEPEGITADREGFIYVTSHHSKIIVF